MYSKLLSIVSGGLVATAWLLGSANSAAAADDRNPTAVQVQAAVGTTESANVQLVDHRRHRSHHRDGFGVSVYLGSPGYYNYPDYGYYYTYPRSYYYPRRSSYYDTSYRYSDPYYGSYYYYRW